MAKILKTACELRSLLGDYFLQALVDTSKDKKAQNPEFSKYCFYIVPSIDVRTEEP